MDAKDLILQDALETAIESAKEIQILRRIVIFQNALLILSVMAVAICAAL